MYRDKNMRIHKGTSPRFPSAGMPPSLSTFPNHVIILHDVISGEAPAVMCATHIYSDSRRFAFKRNTVRHRAASKLTYRCEKKERTIEKNNENNQYLHQLSRTANCCIQSLSLGALKTSQKTRIPTNHADFHKFTTLGKCPCVSRIIINTGDTCTTAKSTKKTQKWYHSTTIRERQAYPYHEGERHVTGGVLPNTASRAPPLPPLSLFLLLPDTIYSSFHVRRKEGENKTPSALIYNLRDGENVNHYVRPPILLLYFSFSAFEVLKDSFLYYYPINSY